MTLSGSERAVLGHLLNTPADTPGAVLRLLEHAPESFEDLRHGKLAVAIREHGGNPVGLAPVVGRDLSGLLSELPDEDCGPGVAALEAETCWEAYRTRRTRQSLDDAQQALAAAPGKLDVVLTGLRGMLSDLEQSATSNREWLRFYSPSECRSYEPPTGLILVGECHVTRGSTTVIAGPPGVGKSRAAVALAVAGATGKDWFALPVRRRFRTLIVQAENGRHRLASEFAGIDGDVDGWIRVSEPPQYGMAFDSQPFRDALARFIEEFSPEVIVLDPWNSIARDDRHRDYRQAFDDIRATLPKGDDAPALIIVAHTRKPQGGDDRKTGRGLLAEVSGSYVLGSVPRSVFVMQAGSDDPEDPSVVWTCAKNSDGPLGPRTAWHRQNGLFSPAAEFDWDTFDRGGKDKRGRPSEHDAEKLRGLLPPEGLTAGDWQDKAELAKTTFYRLRRELERAGRVIRSAQSGRWQPIEEKGSFDV